MAHITTPTPWLPAQTPNTTNSGTGGNDQSVPKTVALANGNFVVLWVDNSDGGPGGAAGKDIIGQIFSPLGAKVGNEFIANQGWFVDDEENFDVAALPNGGFVIVFEDNDINGTSIRATEWNADASTYVFRDITTDPGADLLSLPHVAVQSDGSYVVTYSNEVNGAGGSLQTIARIVSSAGVVGSELLLMNSSGAGSGQEGNDVDILTNGNYVVAGVITDTGNEGIYIRIINAAGTNVTGITLVDNSVNDNYEPVVAALSGGGFVVVWTNTDVNDTDLYFQRYNANGTTAGVRAQINNISAADNNHEPSVVGLDDGGFMIVWNDDDAGVINGQRYDASGGTVGSMFVIADSLFEFDPDVTLLDDGRIVVAWSSFASILVDIDVGIQIYDPRENTIFGTSGDDAITARVDGSVIVAGSGADTLYGSAVFDWLYGGSGNDIIYAGDGATDVSLGDAGNDTIYGQGGFDYIYGYADDDILWGGNDVDVIYGGTGTDSLYGEADTDWLYGGSGNDYLYGGANPDLLFGEAGSDVVNAGTGNDWIWGGASDGLGDGAADRFVFDNSSGVDVIYDFEDGVDRIDLSGATASSFADISVGQIVGGFTWIAYGTNVLYLWGAGNQNVGAGNIDASDFIFV